MIQEIFIIAFASLWLIAIAIYAYKLYREANNKYRIFYIKKDFADDVISKVMSVTNVPKNNTEAIEFDLRCARIVCEEKLTGSELNKFEFKNHEFYI